jgi:nucleotide-binding universal stress UspA family protein
MKKILVATDFSTCAGNAMEYAMELAKVLGFEICAVHAIGPMEGVNNNTYAAIYINDYQNHKKQALATWADTYSSRDEYKDVPVTTFCEVGSVSSVLTKYAESNAVELLVMGNMGSTGISGLFGSNVSAMVEKTKIPTLIIPAGEQVCPSAGHYPWPPTSLQNYPRRT